MALPGGPSTRKWTLHETSVAIYSHEDLCDKVFIAAGGMGAVCRYRNKKLGHDVVVKTCINLSLEEEKNLMEEAKLQLNSATHINIVRLLGFVVLQNSSKGIMLEYMEEGSLHQVIHEPVGKHHYVYTRANIVDWSAEIASALYFLHSSGLKHLDLKPNNILMFSNRMSVKIADFGISKFESAAETGSIKGSKCFMAPETFTSGSCCESDVFSYAIVLWMMIYRDCHPYKTPNGAARVLGLDFQNEFERGLRPNIDDSLENILRELLVRCWADVSNRYSSRILLEKLAVMRDDCRHLIMAPQLEKYRGTLTPPLTVQPGTVGAANGTAASVTGTSDCMNWNITSMSDQMSRKMSLAADIISQVQVPSKSKSLQELQADLESALIEIDNDYGKQKVLIQQLEELKAEKMPCEARVMDYQDEVKECQNRRFLFRDKIEQEQEELQSLYQSREEKLMHLKKCELLQERLEREERTAVLMQLHLKQSEDEVEANAKAIAQCESDLKSLQTLISSKQTKMMEQQASVEALRGRVTDDGSTLSTVCVRRLEDYHLGITEAADPQRLCFSTTHKMLLRGVEVYESRSDPKGACARLTISSPGGQSATCFVKLWQTTHRKPSRRENLVAPLEVLPFQQYLIELEINDKELFLYGGHWGEEKIEVAGHPGHYVHFTDSTDCPIGTSVKEGQFAALYFSVV